MQKTSILLFYKYMHTHKYVIAYTRKNRGSAACKSSWQKISINLSKSDVFQCSEQSISDVFQRTLQLHHIIVIKCWGDSESSLSYTKNKRVFQLPGFSCERPSSETLGALESFLIFQNSSFGPYPSSPAGLSNELRKTQGARVSVRLIVFFRDETPEANLVHPGSLGLGFVWVVSSSLTSNDFKFDCDSMFQVMKGTRRKGNLQTD
jgi:hypothetical protein